MYIFIYSYIFYICVQIDRYTHKPTHKHTYTIKIVWWILLLDLSLRINLSFSGPYVYEKQSISHSERITHFQFSLLTFELRGEVTVCLCLSVCAWLGISLPFVKSSCLHFHLPCFPFFFFFLPCTYSPTLTCILCFLLEVQPSTISVLFTPMWKTPKHQKTSTLKTQQ